jgi:hypothetical protein
MPWDRARELRRYSGELIDRQRDVLCRTGGKVDSRQVVSTAVPPQARHCAEVEVVSRRARVRDMNLTVSPWTTAIGLDLLLGGWIDPLQGPGTFDVVMRGVVPLCPGW